MSTKLDIDPLLAITVRAPTKIVEGINNGSELKYSHYYDQFRIYNKGVFD